MKKTFILVLMAFFLVGTLAFAEEAMLIDFTLLDADVCADDNGNATQNGRTVMDFSVTAGATFTDEQKSLMKTSLVLPSWEVKLNSSAKNTTSLALSKVVPAPVSSESIQPFAGKNVMGVRILFPTWAANANARIEPAFEIPAYEPMATADENGNLQPPTDEEKASGKTRFEGGYGIVKNVGTIRSISVTTEGMNFPHALYVILEDTDGVERRHYMGNLLFDGWRELQWDNPNYISDVRTREYRVVPIYPRGLPFTKFIGFQVTRDAMDAGDDFIGYFKDVKIIYDKAVLTTERDIADEDLWGIITTKERAKQNAEMSRFGGVQVLRFLESQKMATEDQFQPSLKSANSDSE
ncbi:MAG: flagellar filament outer layer protein FlaA [Treponemataceae bacterium]